MEKPVLNKNISLKDFKDFYWLKEELVAFCKSNEITTSGGKINLASRIEQFLTDGKIPENSKIIKKSNSKFDWHGGELSLKTIITDNYKNTQNVRRFFSEQLGKKFNFNVKFMNWFKDNIGNTLEDAINEYKRLEELKSSGNFENKIDSQFEYNQYIRDFLADNKDKNIKDAISFWKLKRELPGPKSYLKSDLDS